MIDRKTITPLLRSGAVAAALALGGCAAGNPGYAGGNPGYAGGTAAGYGPGYAYDSGYSYDPGYDAAYGLGYDGYDGSYVDPAFGGLVGGGFFLNGDRRRFDRDGLRRGALEHGDFRTGRAGAGVLGSRSTALGGFAAHPGGFGGTHIASSGGGGFGGGHFGGGFGGGHR